MVVNKAKTMLSLNTKILWFALFSRLILIIIQAISNLIIPDHDANVFISPQNPNISISIGDTTINLLLNGFKRWDAQYFIHIAQYGYTYENTLAFFPLYPIIVRLVSNVFYFLLKSVLNYDSVLLLTAVFLNVFFFVKSALSLYKLSVKILHNEKVSYVASILYCVNPASIFFSAPYSESLYAWCTFQGMLKCLDTSSIRFGNIAVSCSLPIGLSLATRSNGFANIGFILYYWTKNIVQKMLPEIVNRYRNLKVIYIAPCLLLPFFIATVQLVLTLLIVIMPFILIQMYNYYKYCTNNEHYLPKFLIDFANNNKFVLPGQQNINEPQSWCLDKFPVAYSYIQSHYWDVGLFRYYKLKQIPNFLLASPLMIILIYYTTVYLKRYKWYATRLGIFNVNFFQVVEKRREKYTLYTKEMFVFVIHNLFLVIFCLLLVHIQVSTRLICSASPVLYWFCAYLFDNKLSVNKSKNVRMSSHSHKSLINDGTELYESLFSKWRTFLFTNKVTGIPKFIKIYFFTYFVIGTILFSNFYPWT